MIILSDLELIIQAFNNVAKTYGGRTETLLKSVAKEINRLHTAQERGKSREMTRRYRANDAARRVGAELPYPELDDIPF
jgi:hypothetical protein